MKLFSKITTALFTAAVVSVCVPNVAYAGGHHARAVIAGAHCYQDIFCAEAFCYQDGVCTGNGSCDVYGICRNGGICTGTAVQPQVSPEYFNVPDAYGSAYGGCYGYNSGCYQGYYSGHHSGRGHRSYHH